MASLYSIICDNFVCLFIKNRKSKKFWLIILPFDKKFDFKEFEKRLNDRLKFANINNLKEILELEPGSVSPFGLINDKENITKLLIDKEVWDSDWVSFHPNINTETLELKGEDFRKFAENCGNLFEIF